MYGLTVALLVTILVLGTLVASAYLGVDYLAALLYSLGGIGVFLLAISWVWSPFTGTGGVEVLWTRYLLNIGTPFERWLADLADLADEALAPESFLGQAMGRLTALPWVVGVRWCHRAPSGHALREASEWRQVGETSRHVVPVRIGALDVELHTRRRVISALALHARLLVRVIHDFYQSKVRERELAERAHLSAIYETGARVTHDIKNLLQSLYTLTVAVRGMVSGGRTGQPRGEVEALLERQLPQICERLQLALEKLRAPGGDETRREPLSAWWAALRPRLDALLAEHGGVLPRGALRVRASLRDDPLVPGEVLDSIVQNLLENLRLKARREPDIEVEIALSSTPEGFSLTVRDTGSGIDPSVLPRLLEAPVPSRDGLGVGLHQSARLAEQHGLHLSVCSAEAGEVCFELRGRGHGGPSGSEAPGARRSA